MLRTAGQNWADEMGEQLCVSGVMKEGGGSWQVHTGVLGYHMWRALGLIETDGGRNAIRDFARWDGRKSHWQGTKKGWEVGSWADD